MEPVLQALSALLYNNYHQHRSIGMFLFKENICTAETADSLLPKLQQLLANVRPLFALPENGEAQT